MDPSPSVDRWQNDGGPSQLFRLAVALEAAGIFAGILLYIWRWQHTEHWAWIALWALVLVSHAVHHHTWRSLGLGWTGMRGSAQWVLPLALVLYIPMMVYGRVHHRLELLHLSWASVILSLLGYGSWCAFQQYLTQSYFHNRLMLVIGNRHLRCFLVGILFGATHIPSVVLMIATFIAGFVFAEVFSSYRNIWPLALAQAVGGLLLATVAPDALIHHMRVGPGYFFYGIR